MGSLVLVYKKDQKGKAGWKGPFTLLKVEGELCIMDQSTVANVFRTTYVRPFRNIAPDDDALDNALINEEAKKDVFYVGKKDAPFAIKKDPPSVINKKNPSY